MIATKSVDETNVMSPAEAARARTVFILLLESRDEPPAVLGVFASRQGVEAARQTHIAAAHARGDTVWNVGPPSSDEATADTYDWRLDWDIDLQIVPLPVEP